MPASRFVRRLILAAALGGAVSVLLAVTASLPATLDALSGFRWSLGPLILGATLLNYALRFLKWDFYLHRLAVPLPRRQSLLVFLAGFTMSITPGKLGEVLKAFLVRDLVGTELSRIASVVMAERLTDVAGLVILSALGVTALPHGAVLLGSLTTLLALTVLALRARPVADLAHATLLRGRRLARLAEPLRLFVGAGRTLLAPGALAWAVALSVISWFFECVGFALVLHGLGLTVPLRVATFLYAFASLAGAVSMLPGGLGVAEGSLTALLVAVGAPLPRAAAATLLIRAATLWLAVGLGVITLAIAFRRTPAMVEPAAS